jgi:hypothetical protein
LFSNQGLMRGLIGLILLLPLLASAKYEFDLHAARQSNQKLVQCSKSAFVTFIMPSSASRASITTSIHSLIGMTSCEWRLIVVYSTISYMGDDNLEDDPPIQLSRYTQSFENDPRIFYLPYQRLSLFNYGGSSRNAAMRHVTTEWIAFLDDDDEVSSDYLTVCRRESQLHPSVSVILFRMSCASCFATVIPPVPYPALVLNYVGQLFISFPSSLFPSTVCLSVSVSPSLFLFF